MEQIYIAKNLIKHNGRRYSEGEEISLDESSAKRLLELKAVQPTEKPTYSDNTHPDPAGAGASPNEESWTARVSRGRNGDADAALQTRLTRTSKTGTTLEVNPDEQTNPPAPQTYVEMTNAQQLEYLSSLSDGEFKTRYDELLEVSKSKSKTFAEKRMKSLNTDNETQE